MRIHLTILFLTAGFGLLILGCGDKADPIIESDTDIEFSATVTYEEHVKPIMEASCTGCHATTKQGPERSGAPAGVNLDNFQVVKESSERSNARIQGGTMPPYGSVDGNGKATFQQWIDDGMRDQ